MNGRGQLNLLEDKGDYSSINVDGTENWKNRSVFVGDCLDVMRQMNSGSVHLIYLDPPFNKDKQFQAPIGSAAEGAEFKDFWDWSDIHPYEADELEKRYPAAVKVVHAAYHTYDKGMAAYCLMMASRLIEMRRILKPNGSIYLHCDPTASHYIKLLLDGIFGKANFRNEIVWHYGGTGSPTTKFPAKHDLIFFYGKSKKNTFNQIKVPAKKTSGWTGRDTKLCDSVWAINTVFQSSERSERTGYPTQKPIELLDRIILASSNEGDIVLDPFCGCATTLLAAEKLNRQYCGIDISQKAGQLLRHRLKEKTKQGVVGKGIAPEPIILSKRPTRTDLEKEMTAAQKKTYKDYLFGKQDGRCAGCNTGFPKRNLTLDRIVPGKNGGEYRAGNLQLLCQSCNSTKGDRPQEFLKKRLIEQGLYAE